MESVYPEDQDQVAATCKVIPVSLCVFLSSRHDGNHQQGGPETWIWMQKRLEFGPLNGLWEFPGGKIESDETPLKALVREVWEEIQYPLTDEKIPDLHFFKNYIHLYEDRKVSLYCYYFNLPCQSERDSAPFKSGQWFSLSSFKQKENLQLVPFANHELINDLLFSFNL